MCGPWLWAADPHNVTGMDGYAAVLHEHFGSSGDAASNPAATGAVRGFGLSSSGQGGCS